MNVQEMGKGMPLVLMHGGPGGDLYTMVPFKACKDCYTLVFYDHRANGRSGGEASSMTWDNLTADADALRQALGFHKWAVLGHSFGGNVALEYAVRYPQSLSHLILVNTGGESRWPQENAADLLAQRGFSPEMVSLARRFFSGQMVRKEVFPALMKLGPAYFYHMSTWQLIHMALTQMMRTKVQPDATLFWFGRYHRGWTIMDRLSEIRVPTLVLAGSYDFVYPPECQEALAAGIPGARLVLIPNAGHNPMDEKPAETFRALRAFLSGAA